MANVAFQPVPTYADLVRRFGLAFRPDLPAVAYGEHAQAYIHRADADIHDTVVRTTDDPYAAALAVWQQDGLLGADDPGPPAFRAAHAAYLAARAGPPQALILEHDVPRPRIPLQEILDAVSQFSRETSPLRINTRMQGTFTEMERVFGIHRNALVAWFAARGVDVDPEA